MPQDEPRTSPHSTGSGRRWLAWALLALAALVLVLVTRQWGEVRRKQEIASLKAQDRQVLFQHTLLSFRDLCVDRPLDSNLESYCKRQRDFLQAFPECTMECQALLKRFAPPGGTR